MTNKLLVARTADIVMQELNDELLSADLSDNRAHCLNQTLATRITNKILLPLTARF